MKKNTVRWVVSSVAFCLLGLFLFGTAAEVLRKKVGDSSDMVHSFYEVEKNTMDVLVLGSSHAYSSFNPNILWETYGITSYVMASPRQPVALSYYLLKEALQYQKPEVVVLEVYYSWYDEKNTDMSRIAVDALRPGPVKNEMVQDLYGDLSWKERFDFAVPFTTYHSRWKELKNSDFHKQPFLLGGILDYSVQALTEPGLPTEAGELSEITWDYLGRIQELCREYDSSLVLFAAPFSYVKNSDPYMKKQAKLLALEQYANAEGIPFWNYQKMPEAGIDFTADFRDEGHMNWYGAEKLTKHLGNWMRGQYALADHRGDPAYAFWEACCERYLAEAELLKSEAASSGKNPEED